MSRRAHVKVTGVVQGVGFRPFVYGLAVRLGLGGYVLNDSRGVEIELEGESARVDEFLGELRSSPPPLAAVKGVEVAEIEPRGEGAFEIRKSERREGRTVLVSPDHATCADCLREMLDPSDRRHRYPFINCTNCGPRYTIIQDLPYDRAKTTMSAFEMCPECRLEYEDPLDRRFHAEPACCPACGPRVWLADRSGVELDCADPLRECVRLLDAGRVVAVKGLGGFHLACDASNDEAVRELRARKAREQKPLAMMVKDVQAARAVAVVSEAEERLLSGPERPILLLRKREGGGLSGLVAPKSATLGVMLPYTPLHHLLMEGACPALVMTSGNVTDEPIAHRNEDALERLSDVAERFLLHDREIHIRTDDSVARVTAGGLRFLRRSRGYAPFPVELPFETAGREVLSVGPELNNTVCLTRGRLAFLSHHVGDLKNAPAWGAFLQAVEHLSNVLEVSPKALSCDMHPGYLSTRYARESGLPVFSVQHHHAHVASVLAEHGRTDRVIGVSFDGLGWGEGGEVWGGEFLVCDLGGCERAGHIELLPLPGGDATTRRPPRMAYVYLRAVFGEEADGLAREMLPSLSDEERGVVARMIERRLNTPLTSSAGRLFDAASALLGICAENTYEGQAPMELEGAASAAGAEEGFYSARIEEEGGRSVVRTSDVLKALVGDARAGVARETCAARFHNSVARFVTQACARVRERTSLRTVALSGGVFANAFLVERLKPLLEAQGLEVLLNSAVPPGDGGVSLGQAAVAAWRLTCV